MTPFQYIFLHQVNRRIWSIIKQSFRRLGTANFEIMTFFTKRNCILFTEVCNYSLQSFPLNESKLNSVSEFKSFQSVMQDSERTWRLESLHKPSMQYPFRDFGASLVSYKGLCIIYQFNPFIFLRQILDYNSEILFCRCA